MLVDIERPGIDLFEKGAAEALLAVGLIVAPSAAYAKTSSQADGTKRAICFRVIPGEAGRAARTIKVACTARSIPPVLDPTPYFLP